MQLTPRSKWTANVPSRTTGPFTKPTGLVFHYVGSKGTLVNRDPYGLMEQMRKIDMDRKNWSDIMYSVAVPFTRREVIQGRGFSKKPGSQGKTYNATHGSVVILGGTQDKMNDNVIANCVDAARLWLDMYPGADDWKLHSEVRSTWCPGGFNTITKVLKQELKKPSEPIAPVGTFECNLPNYPLHTGLKNQDVGQLIEMLTFWSYYSYKNDFYYGPATKQSVINLQRDLKAGGHYHGELSGQFTTETREAWCTWLRMIYDMITK
jgi:hypothetical protein